VTGLVQQRTDVVEEKNRVTHQLPAALKRFSPRALELFSQLEQPLTLDFLTAFPTPTALQQASLAGWQLLFAGKRYPRPQRIAASLWEQAQATQVPVSATDEALGERAVSRLVRLLRVLLEEWAQLNEPLATHFPALPEAKVFTARPGAGPVLAPALFSLFGDDRAAWRQGREMAQAYGTVPTTRRSGRSSTVQQRQHCDKRARRILHLFAGSSLRRGEWAQQFYAEQRRRGQAHATILRNLATKRLRILFRLWQDGVAYEEAEYLRRRADRQGPREAPPAVATA
jgi:hypothetical protein